jgi:hypothetical protein
VKNNAMESGLILIYYQKKNLTSITHFLITNNKLYN